MPALNFCNAMKACQISVYTVQLLLTSLHTVHYLMLHIDASRAQDCSCMWQKHLGALLQPISGRTGDTRILCEPSVRKVQYFSPGLIQNQQEQKHMKK